MDWVVCHGSQAGKRVGCMWKKRRESSGRTMVLKASGVRNTGLELDSAWHTDRMESSMYIVFTEAGVIDKCASSLMDKRLNESTEGIQPPWILSLRDLEWSR